MGTLAVSDFRFDEKIPYYLQLKSLLDEKLDKRELRPGDKLPSEAEICGELGISRTVVRQALMELEHEGRVVKRKGKGTFAAEPKIVESFVQQPSGFYDDMMSQELPTHSEVLRLEVVHAGGRVTHPLQLRADARVILLKRLRFVEDDPIQLVSSYLPYKLCPVILTADFREQSLYRFLEQRGIFIARGFRNLEAVGASADDARLLRVEAGSPMIHIDSIVYAADGTPVEYYEATHRGDRTRFRVELVRHRTRSAQGTVGRKLKFAVPVFGVEILAPHHVTQIGKDTPAAPER